MPHLFNQKQPIPNHIIGTWDPQSLHQNSETPIHYLLTQPHSSLHKAVHLLTMFGRGKCSAGLRRITETNRREPLDCEVSEPPPTSAPGAAGVPLHQPEGDLTTTLNVAEINNAACTLYEEGRVSESLEMLEQVAEVSRAFGRVHQNPTLAIILRNTSQIKFVQGQISQATKLSKGAIDANGGVDEHLAASLWFNLGFLEFEAENSYEEAEWALGRSLQLLTGLRSDSIPFSPTTVDRDIVSAEVLLLLIRSRSQTRARGDAMSLIRLLMTQRATFGYEHESIYKTLSSLGSVYAKQRNYGTAINFLLEALRLQHQLGLLGGAKLTTLTQMGQCLNALGRELEGMSCFREGLRLHTKTIMNEPPAIQEVFATALYNIGMIQSNQGDRNDQRRRMRALHSFKLCLDLRRKVLGEESPAVASVLYNIGILVLEDGQVTKAMGYFLESLHIRRKAFGPRHPEVASSLCRIANIHYDRGDIHVALKLNLRALSILRHSNEYFPDSLLLSVLTGVGDAHQSSGLIDQAMKSYEEAHKLLRRIKEKGGKNVTQHMIRVLNIMGDLSLDVANIEAANRFFAEAARLSGQRYVYVNRVPPCAAAA